MGGDAACPQHVESRLRVRDVGSRHDRGGTQRPSAGAVDRARSRAGHEHAGFHVEQRRRRRHRETDVVHEVVAVVGPGLPQRVHVEAARVVDAAGQGRHRDDATAPAHHLAGDRPADLPEALHRDRAAVERPDRGFRGDRDAEAGDDVLEDDAVHQLQDRMGGSRVAAERCEIGLRRPEVGAGEEHAPLDQRADLLAVPAHRVGAFAGRGPYAGLGPAHAPPQHGELVGHGPGQQGHFGLGDVRREACPTATDLITVDVEHDEGLDGGQPQHPHGRQYDGSAYVRLR